MRAMTLMRGLVVTVSTAAVVSLGGQQAPPDGQGPPFPPAAALATLQVEEGLRVELMAAEPDVMSPVAIDVDEDGRIYVVEMPGYPLDTSPSGRVRLLEDTNRDGRVDRSTVFADRLVLPSGVLRWRDGIIVTAAPDILYFEDTNGDGRADVRRVLLNGFAATNPQHTVNTPLYGLDGWIYLAHEGYAEALIFADRFGDRGRPLTFPDAPDQTPLDPKDRSVRFRLDPPRIESLASGSQYGHAFDVWGRYFTVDNSHHGRHEVIAARYLERNPDFLIERATHDVPDHGNAPQVFPITHNPRFELLSEVGQITSACSLTFYQGGAWPERFANSAFVAEPVHNLVHRDVYEPAGATFVARRALERREFLASTDAWFRPVHFYNAPDGSLLVADYYRRVIEHPEWTASDLHVGSPALYDGKDFGRIYRIVPEAGGLDAWPVAGQLRGASDADLVALLGHRNAWWRRTAQRLLVDRKSDASVPLLIDAARQRPSAFVRLHALWTLELLGKLPSQLIELALGDEEPGVRENALRLAEPRLTGAGADPALRARVLAMGSEPNARVRFQLLATLGSVDGDEARALHERLLLDGVEDEWMQVAGLSAASDRAAALMDRVLGSRNTGPLLIDRETPGRARLLERLAAIVTARGAPEGIDAMLQAAASGNSADVWWRAAMLRGIGRSLGADEEARRVVAARERVLLGLAGHDAAPIRRASLDVLRRTGLSSAVRGDVVTRAAEVAQDAHLPAERRADAIALVRLAGPAPHVFWLQRAIDPAVPEPVQRAAVEALGAIPGTGVGQVLLERWASLTPPVRSAAANAMLADPARTRQLVDALADGRVPSWSLDFWQKRALLMNDDEAIRTEARRLLEEKPEQRQAIVERYAAALNLRGDPKRGREVFDRVCAACHRLDDAGGGNLGPDLGTVRHKPVSALLTDILVPNQAIAQRYETYLVERTDGTREVGVIGSQTPTSITLRQQTREITIPRGEIRQLSIVPQSAMPPDLDQLIDPQQMADLLTFIVGPARP